MSYQVRVQRLALQDLRTAYEFARSRAPEQAGKWLDRLEKSLQRLDERPERCALAWEHRKVGIEVREYLFGKRPWVFRILFVIDGATVRILRILRAQRRYLTSRELRDALDQAS